MQASSKSSSLSIAGDLEVLFLEDWNEKLQRQKTFEFSDSKRLVTKENIGKVLKAIEIDQLVQVQQAKGLLDYYQGEQAPFDKIYKEFVKLIDSVAEPNGDDFLFPDEAPAEKVVKMLIRFKQKYLKNDHEMEKEFNFAINTINDNKIVLAQGASAEIQEVVQLSKQNSQVMEWLNEKDPNQRRGSILMVNLMKYQPIQQISVVPEGQSTKLQMMDISDSSSSSSPRKSQTSKTVSFQKQQKHVQQLRRKSEIRSLLNEYTKYEELLMKSNSREFEFFKFMNLVGRDKTFPILSAHLILQHHLDVYINDRKFQSFLTQVQNTYRREVQYHNDLHGVDVAHCANLILTKGKLISIADLDHVDMLGVIIGAMCHDLGHDGYTNAFHVNTFSERAIRHNDVSVQESYHAAEMFSILSQQQFNFLEQLTKQEFSVFRKRAVGCILATDMAKHGKDLKALSDLIAQNGIKNGQNSELVINRENEKTIFESQQFMLEICLHTCDVSQQTRNFQEAKQWTYWLYEEFFDQGDKEKELGMPMSYLCDRTSYSVPKMQKGFLTGITIPLWTAMSEVMPGLRDHLETAKKNLEIWENYEETEEDKKSYTKHSNIFSS